MRVIGKVLGMAGAMALAAGMTVEANAMAQLGGLSTDSQMTLVAEKKPEAKKPEAKKAEPKAEAKKAEPKKAEATKPKAKKAAVKKTGKKKVVKKKGKKTCGVGKYHKKGKCVDAATNPVKPKPAKVKKAKKK